MALGGGDKPNGAVAVFVVVPVHEGFHPSPPCAEIRKRLTPGNLWVPEAAVSRGARVTN
jgi:hypothetical protein